MRPHRLIVAALILLLPLTPLSPAAAQDQPWESLVLHPGVDEQNAEPQTWSLDLTALSREEAQAAAEGMSTRLYGTDRPASLQQPITFTTGSDVDSVFGFFISAVSLAGSTLDIALDGEHFARLSWPRASSTHQVQTLYLLDLPAGRHEVCLEVAKDAATSTVVIPEYAVYASREQVPPDRTTVVLEREDPPEPPVSRDKADGYRGIWFTLGQFSEYGDKYSGGLGTYTMKHTPLAVHAPEVGKTFFTYGGTTAPDERHLLIMAAEYDHATHRVPRPTIVHDKQGVDDPHDNASIALDGDGHVWIFVSGRGSARPGFKYRSLEPYSVDAFERVTTEEMTYPQPRYIEGEGFLHLFTKYTAGRELYWETSPDGVTWTEDRKLAGFGGHYQTTAERDGRVVTAFNYHPNGVDTRTNLYVALTDDRGETWTTVEGEVLSPPLDHPDNPALVVDYEARGRLVYVKEAALDADGNPVVLYLTSSDHRPGPAGDPRTWHVAAWDGAAWRISDIIASDHNYDAGSLYLDGDHWRVVAPTDPGPQPWQTGGELVVWDSDDAGRTWRRGQQVTRDSERNHGYARRPLEVREPFFAFWADGDPTQLSPSSLYFSDSTGRRVWRLPSAMAAETAQPIALHPGPCPVPDLAPTVLVGGDDTGVPNRVSVDGCTVTQILDEDAGWASHGRFVAHGVAVTADLVTEGTLSGGERLLLIRAAARSDVGAAAAG